ncbi:MAG: amidohydrolase family protein [Candidatus Binatia bacterium]
MGGDRVVAHGGVADPQPAATTTIDLGGAHVLPGFCDPHSHLSVGAWLPAVGDGRPWRSLEEALAAVRTAAVTAPPGGWLVFGRVNAERWPGSRLPSAAALDAASGGRPVLLVDVTLHRGALSTEGLRRCAVTRSAPDPLGDVERGRRGEPTGIVWEQAFGRALDTALRALASDVGETGTDGLLDRAATEHLRFGLTRVHEPGVPPDVHVRLAALAARTPLRLSWSASAATGLLEPPPLPDALPPGPYGEGPVSAKLFLDGAHRCALCLPPAAVLASLGAAVRAALVAGDVVPLRTLASQRVRLAGRHLHVAWGRFDDRALHARVGAYAGAGVALRVHALGNLAVTQAARALATVRPPHATVEHVLAARREDADLLAACAATASTQPGFIPTYAPTMDALGLGNGGTVRPLPLRTLRDAGVPLAISSDHPCGPLDPLHNLRLAVTRHRPDGGAFVPSEAITPLEAVHAATAQAAAAAGFAGEGVLVPGAPADLVILTGDPFVDATVVTRTWVGGRQAWPVPDSP